ncbi:MAG: peptidylprolyl isomerase [Steroidobacteraceae bacterium]|nr:peptidylprolyl isomerase [Deltaproteobacteria bacterium]
MNIFAKFTVSGCCFLFIMSLMIGTAPAATTPEKADKTVVARVNGTVIYHDELAPLLESAKARYRKQGNQSISPDLEKNIQSKELDQLIGRELLAQAGAKVDDKAFAEKVELRIKALTQARFHNASSAEKAKSVTIDPHQREILRKDALVDAYLEKSGIANLQVPEKNLKEFYEKNKQGLAVLETVKASHIMVELSKKAKAADVEEARKKIQSISDELKKGGDFAELARKHSNCASAANGGDLGYIKRGYMPGDFNKVAFALKPGETSEPIRTQHGFHIVRVFDKKPERVQEFPEVKDTIAKYLIRDYKRTKIEEIISELKLKAKIERYLND